MDKPVNVNSIAASLLGLDHSPVLRGMQHARGEMLRFYMSEPGGNLSAEEAKIRVDTCLEGVDETVSYILSQSAETASWYGLEKLYAKPPAYTKTVWRLVKEEARVSLRAATGGQSL